MKTYPGKATLKWLVINFQRYQAYRLKNVFAENVLSVLDYSIVVSYIKLWIVTVLEIIIVMFLFVHAMATPLPYSPSP